MASATNGMNFQLVFNFNLSSSYIWLMATVLGTTGLDVEHLP